MKRRHAIALCALITLVLALLLYTRPMTLKELCGWDITQCDEVLAVDFTLPYDGYDPPRLPRGDERAEQLIELFSRQKFRRSLLDLPPFYLLYENITIVPQCDETWQVYFYFPNGDDDSPLSLNVLNHYGDLTIYFPSGHYSFCGASQKEAFLRQVYDIISAEP